MIKIAQLSCGTEYSSVQYEIEKAARSVGLSNEHIGAILDRLVDLHWKEIEWLDQHPDEVPA